MKDHIMIGIYLNGSYYREVVEAPETLRASHGLLSVNSALLPAIESMTWKLSDKIAKGDPVCKKKENMFPAAARSADPMSSLESLKSGAFAQTAAMSDQEVANLPEIKKTGEQ
jgi:hypothetical protein